MVGSRFYAEHLPTDQRPKSVAMVNLDTLGLSPTKIWASHSDSKLTNALVTVAAAMKLSVQGVNVEQVGSTDSESFAHRGIPSITIHSLTQETLPILHTTKDKFEAIKLDDYYASYRLTAGYLAFLDDFLKPVSDGDPVTQQRKTDPK